MTHVTRTLRRILQDVSYADRRSFELRTGLNLEPARRGSDRQVAELNAAWALDHRTD
jgi:hypothetical protein